MMGNMWFRVPVRMRCTMSPRYIRVATSRSCAPVTFVSLPLSWGHGTMVRCMHDTGGERGCRSHSCPWAKVVYHAEGERGSHAGAPRGVSVSEGCQGHCAHLRTRACSSVRLSDVVVEPRTRKRDSVPNVRRLRGALACCRSCTLHNHTDPSRMLSFCAQLPQVRSEPR